jgi:serine/threonine protein phosphatase PrpC
MSVIRQLLKGVYKKLLPKKDVRSFNEQPTRPLDAKALARALAGEGRRHVSTGCARLTLPENAKPKSSLYTLMAQSDGINALPDFGVVGVAECENPDVAKSNLSKVALSSLVYQITQNAILDFLEIEGFENSTPLQNIVVEAMDIADQVVCEKDPVGTYSLTAGLIFADIMILGHSGDSRAYQIDRHHIERITAIEINPDGLELNLDSSEEPLNAFKDGGVSKGTTNEVVVYSRPIPRDGYILLCTNGLWKSVSERDIHKIVVDQADPQEACQTFLTRVREMDSGQEFSVLLLYFPPDYGPWR